MYKSLFFALCCFLLLGSCAKNKNRVEIPFNTILEIPAGLSTIRTHHFVQTVNTFGSVPEGLEEIQPAQFQLFLEDGQNSFDFVRRAFIDIVTDTSRTEIAFQLDPRFDGSTSMFLNPSIANVKEYLMNDDYKIELKLELRSVTTATSRIRMNLVFSGIYE